MSSSWMKLSHRLILDTMDYLTYLISLAFLGIRFVPLLGATERQANL